MISIFKERKKKVSEIFNKTSNDLKFSYSIQGKDMIFCINTNDNVLSNYIKNTYQGFLTNKSFEYIFNFHQAHKNVVIDIHEDNLYTYDYIRFINTFFYYRYSKSSNLIDVILPSEFEFWEFENFFKIFISSISLQYNSLLIHASAVMNEGKAILFSGQSGAGKSTIAELSGYEIIHDDNILISHLGDGVFQLETIPFKTPYKKKQFTGRIDGFYRLFQNDKTYIKDVNKNKQLTHLLFGLWAFDYFGNKNTKQYNNGVMKYCVEILPYIQVKELYFTKTTDFLEFI